jgi:sugar/nucleoside kinase (ribokinase family)
MIPAVVKVLGVGSPIVDILVNVDEAFIDRIEGDKGGMELVSSERLEQILAMVDSTPVKATGGSSGNTVLALAKLGHPTAFLGKVGRDGDGDFYRESFIGNGVDSTCFCYADSIHTGRCLSLVTPDSERTMRTDLGAAATLDESDIKLEFFAGITNVHVEGYMLFAGPLLEKVMSMAKEVGCSISIDLASFEVVRFNKEILPGLLEKYVDIVFANEDEAREFCGDVSPEEAAEIFSKYCDTVAVKLGKDGAFLRHGIETARIKAEVVEAVDTTAAGDFWQAGFLYGFLNGCGLEKAGEFGSILGAEVVQVMGTGITDKTWESIRERVNLNK